MNNHWEKFYKTKEVPAEPTSFAKFCAIEWFPRGEALMIWDVGCGNGRDTYFFAQLGHAAMGVDKHNRPADQGRAQFFQDDLTERAYHGDILYSRFFLHSIEARKVQDLIKNSDCTYFMAECRAVGDEPRLYTDHKRNFVDGNWLLKELEQNGYEILYFRKGADVAKLKGENPLVIRIIAKNAGR